MRAHPALALVAVWLLYAGVAFAATPFCDRNPGSALCRVPTAGLPVPDLQPTTD